MPAGDLLPSTDDTYAVECNGHLIADAGFGSAVFFVKDLAGVGDYEVRDHDVQFGLVDGVRATTDTNAGPLIVVTAQCNTGAPGTAEAAYAAMAADWKASSTDTELHLMVPGLGHISYDGRTRGTVCRRVNPGVGYFMVTARFQAFGAYEVIEEP